MRKIYFIGIGGISMSALALLAKAEGFFVGGSDISENEQTAMLKKNNVPIFKGSYRENIAVFSPDLVVYSGAIHDDNDELSYAKQNKLTLMNRGEFLGEISKQYKTIIAVSGSHGKTTTTALIAEIFLAAGLNPTIHIGGVLKKIGSNVHIGSKDFFITEACEYQNAYHSLHPTIGVITNVEADHLDFFGSYENVKISFAQFASQCQKIVMPYDEHFNTNLIGEHNQKNISCAVQTAKLCGIENSVVEKTLLNFSGVKRRFETIGLWRNIPVVHDYANHPTEISAVLKMAEEARQKVKNLDGLHKNKHVLVVFQPHTYSRTVTLFDEFIEVLSACSEVFLYQTYPARELPTKGLSAFDLYLELQNKKVSTAYFACYEQMREKLLMKTSEIDFILILGAGDIDSFADYLMKNP